MKLKDAALFALVGMILLLVLVMTMFVADLLAATRGLIPAVRVVTSLIYVLATLGVTVFFFAFHKS